MNKGYTKIEMLTLIVLVSIVFFVSVNKVSYAFVDNSKELYQKEEELLKTCANKYGNSKKDEIHASVTGLKINIDELVKFGCLKKDKNGKIFSNEKLNSTSLNLTYNTKNDQIEVEVLK